MKVAFKLHFRTFLLFNPLMKYLRSYNIKLKKQIMFEFTGIKKGIITVLKYYHFAYL